MLRNVLTNVSSKRLFTSSSSSSSRVNALPRQYFHARQFSVSRTRLADSPALAKAIRSIQDKFVEAKDEYECALESQGTTYAVEDNETARELAGELSQVYESIMSGNDLSDAEKQTVKEKLSARIRELTNGVENNLHDSH